MPTNTKKPKTASIAVSLHRRVTVDTPTPYLARVFNSAGKPTAIVVMVTEVHYPPEELKMPPWGNATVMSNVKGSYYKRGEVFRVDNFSCLQRLEIVEVADH